MASLRSRAALLPALLFVFHGALGSPEQIASSQPIACAGTPFGQRLTLGVDQEYVVVHGDSGQAGIMNEVRDNGLVLWAPYTIPASSFSTLASSRTTHVDFNGDGRDEWAVAGIKSTDTHTLVVTTIGIGGFGAPFQAPVWSWTASNNANMIDVRVAAADVTGNATDSRQELVVAYLDSAGVVKVLLLDGTASPPFTIQQASGTALAQWTMPAADGSISQLRLASGDLLLEGSDQIVLMGVSANNAKRVYYVLRYNGSSTLVADRYTEDRSQQTAVLPNSFDLRIGDLGGTAAAEMVVLDQSRTVDNTPDTFRLSIRYFTTTRDSVSNALISFDFITPLVVPSYQLDYSMNIGSRTYVAAAIGELDRRPGGEIVLARQSPNDTHLLVELYKAGFDQFGHVISIGPYLAPNAPHGPITTNEEMFVSTMNYLDVTIGQPHADGIGEVAVAVQDQQSLGDATKILKVRSFAMATPSPDPNANPDPTTFARTALFDYPASQSNTLSLHIDRLDYAGDSVYADIDISNCRQVREPQLRSIVHFPPYWQLLQSPAGGEFLATIGRTVTQGTTADSTFGTFTSHDVSGYVGLKIGGEFLGVGASGSVKVTAGYNYQASHGESYGTKNTSTVSESFQQSTGEGLVVEEDNTFDCYTYNVHNTSITDAGSSVRSCELIRYGGDGHTELRGFIGSDLVTWDTLSAYNAGNGLPGQWVPLAPDWASVALFHVPTANFDSDSPLLQATDGRFATDLVSPAMLHPYLQIDLGTAKPLTNVRVFPSAGRAADLDGFSLYVSATAFAGESPPSGPGVTVFAPDPASGNGFDHWNIRLRNPGASQAPLVGRFLRLQGPDAEIRTLAISEIQAFAETHIEPPGYPVWVCDPVADDGLFSARMYDSGTNTYQNVDVRGQLLWTGSTFTDANCMDFEGAEVKHADIWSAKDLGGSSAVDWNLSTTVGNSLGTKDSISNSTRIGVELDVEGGALVKAQVGGAYEFSTGVTEEYSSTMFWETGLEYGGKVDGFDTLRPECNYRAQPFGYTTREKSNMGYEHQYTAVDYYVLNYNWSRNALPITCYALPPDRFFASGFE